MTIGTDPPGIVGWMARANPSMMPRVQCALGLRMETAELMRWLQDLRVEHRDLDEVIKYMIETKSTDHMRIQRLKKRKLRLKDMITKLESELIPNLDA